MTAYRLGTPYEEYLRDRAMQAFGVEVKPEEGTSGYWGQPVTGLDPRLVDGDTDKVREDVRTEILSTLYTFWRKFYNDPESWSTPWIAGSALSHQYAEHMQPDLDVLIGVDYPAFFDKNPAYAGNSTASLSNKFNDEFRSLLDPQTTNFLGEFEATFYVNAGATDIRSINPYAAFNLKDDSWTVRPVDVPENWDPHSFFPAEWWQTLDTEVENAKTLVGQYDALAERVKTSSIGSISQTSALVQLRKIVERASKLFMDIHGKRRNAFGPTGKGYFDYYNLRWQVHKRAGTVKALHDIAVTHELAQRHESQELYGEEKIDDPETALLKAQLFDQTYGKSAWYRRAFGR